MMAPFEVIAGGVNPGPAQADGRIRIFAERLERPYGVRDQDGSHVFVTIGPGETRVSVMSSEGECESSWTATFGWSFLCAIRLDIDGRSVTLEEEATLARAMIGRMRAFGRDVDTRNFVLQASLRFESAIDDILGRTVGSAARHDTIILAAPSWLHGALVRVMDIRPNILREIRES